jgi:hypothetical protein
MTYSVEQTCVFFPWGLTSSECASWVQAWGTILAIAGSAGLALWQAHRQSRASQRQRHLERVQAAEALLGLAKNSRGLQIHLGEKLNGRDAVEKAELSGMPVDMTELRALERALEHLPLQSLDPALVGSASLLTCSLRQYRVQVESLLHQHRRMDTAEFERQREVLNTLAFMLQEALADLERHTARLRDPFPSP